MNFMWTFYNGISQYNFVTLTFTLIVTLFIKHTGPAETTRHFELFPGLVCATLVILAHHCNVMKSSISTKKQSSWILLTSAVSSTPWIPYPMDTVPHSRSLPPNTLPRHRYPTPKYPTPWIPCPIGYPKPWIPYPTPDALPPNTLPHPKYSTLQNPTTWLPYPTECPTPPNTLHLDTLPLDTLLFRRDLVPLIPYSPQKAPRTRDTLSLCEQTDSCENITFPWRSVISQCNRQQNMLNATRKLTKIKSVHCLSRKCTHHNSMVKSPHILTFPENRAKSDFSKALS